MIWVILFDPVSCMAECQAGQVQVGVNLQQLPCIAQEWVLTPEILDPANFEWVWLAILWLGKAKNYKSRRFYKQMTVHGMYFNVGCHDAMLFFHSTARRVGFGGSSTTPCSWKPCSVLLLLAHRRDSFWIIWINVEPFKTHRFFNDHFKPSLCPRFFRKRTLVFTVFGGQG